MKHAALFALVMSAACGSVESPAPNPTPNGRPDVTAAQLDDLPVTCADVLAQAPKSTDGEYILYADADAEQPWSAWCAGMQNGTPAEYLTLMNKGNQYNFGSYASGGLATDTTVMTYYTKVRVDPWKLVVNIGDQRFATSTGSVVHPDGAGITVTSMPLGVAMGCGQYGTANINLEGTMFAVDTGYALAGSSADGMTIVNADKRDVSASGMGWCGWNGPLATPFNPMGKIDAPVLQLRYAP